MINITKLKEQIENARLIAISSLSIAVPPADAEKIADNIIAATIAQIALQAAEKEAEAQEKADHMHNFEMLKDEFEAQQKKKFANPAPIADDGWINWEGGECPVDGAAIVATKWRDGRANKPSAAYHSLWHHDGRYDDIIAYRIIQPAADRVEES